MRTRNIVVGLLLVFCMCFYCVDIGRTATVDVSVTFPSGTFQTQVTKVIGNFPFDGTTDTWPPASTPSETSMAFGSLTELTNSATGAKLGVFGPSDRRYYAVDMAISGGGAPASVDVTLAWVGADSAWSALGKHVSLAFRRMTFRTGQNPLEDALPGITAGLQAMPISQLSTVRHLTIADFTNHWVRTYVGVFTPPDSAASASALANACPQAASGATPTSSQCVPFTSGDVSRTYSAQLQITVI